LGKLNLAGEQRAQMVEFVRRPLKAWLVAHVKGCFPDPKSSEAQDIVAEAAMLALSDAIGEQALVAVALDIIEKVGKKHG